MNTAFGQGNFEVGSNVIGVGIGFGNTYNLGYSYGSQSPAINFQYEHGLWSVGGPGVISLGGYMAFKNYSDNYSIYSTELSHTVIGVRGAYHYNGIPSSKFDVYGGLLIGFRIESHSNTEPYFVRNYGGDRLVVDPFVGGRYYFTDNFAGFGELGTGIGLLSLGIAFKF